jgi:DUF971 family protein
MGHEPVPSSVAQDGPETLRIEWSDGHTSLYPVRLLRLACRCAHCIDEHSGAPRLVPESVPRDVQPLRLRPVGRYAIAFDWSDGHDTGIYSYDQLRQICPCCAGRA